MNVETKSNSIKERVKNLELPKGSSLELLSNGSPNVLRYEHTFNGQETQETWQIDVYIFDDHIELWNNDPEQQPDSYYTLDQIEVAVASIETRVKSNHAWAMRRDKLEIGSQ